MESDGATTSNFTDSEFDYDLELTPRVWVEVMQASNWGWRAGYWQFDHVPALATTSPPANGFGEITSPPFGDVDISSTIPTDTFSASSSLNLYAIDIEAFKLTHTGGWDLGIAGGVRYASVQQNYFAQLRNDADTLRGEIDFRHELEGVGPTLAIAARRPIIGQLQLACAGRGSLLFGDGTSRLVAQEDADLTTPFTTTRIANRDDLLPVAEARVGLEWINPSRRSGVQWLLSSALEGQIWGNAGNAASETGDLGFFGFNVGAGLSY